TIKAVAGSSDTLAPELRMVAAPVFDLLGKKFKTVYDSLFNKLSEVMVTEQASADSAENRLQFFIRYPYEELAPGSSWEKELALKSGNKMNCSAHFTLDSIIGGLAKISVSGKITGKGQSFGHEFGIEGTLSGKIEVDIQTGWPVEGDVKQVFSLDLNGQKIPIESITKYTVTR
ncbi:MAG TPA: DUF6263 family protein, partial [Bacteroidia bacterium]|nr:DUF6263 family protein [Bacteroidia bacterium]